jgi:phage/plasmid-associated DNA primase
VVQAASQAYREDNDHVGEFIGDCCLVAPDASVWAANLWNSYLCWVGDNHDRPLDRKVFSARLEGKGFCKKRVGHDRTWTWFGCASSHQNCPSPHRQLASVRTDADVKTSLLLWKKTPQAIDNNRKITSAHDRANVRRFADRIAQRQSRVAPIR